MILPQKQFHPIPGVKQCNTNCSAHPKKATSDGRNRQCSQNWVICSKQESWWTLHSTEFSHVIELATFLLKHWPLAAFPLKVFFLSFRYENVINYAIVHSWWHGIEFRLIVCRSSPKSNPEINIFFANYNTLILGNYC